MNVNRLSSCKVQYCTATLLIALGLYITVRLQSTTEF